MNYNLYIIYMPRVAAALRKLGFKLVKTEPNRKKPQFDVYWFEDSQAFRQAIPQAVKMAKE